MGADEVNLATLRGSWMICRGRGVARLTGWTARGWGNTVRFGKLSRPGPYISLSNRVLEDIKRLDALEDIKRLDHEQQTRHTGL